MAPVWVRRNKAMDCNDYSRVIASTLSWVGVVGTAIAFLPCVPARLKIENSATSALDPQSFQGVPSRGIPVRSKP